MANLTDRTDKYYVAKVSQRNRTVEFMNVSNISGAISYRSEMESGSYEDAQTVQRVANWLNSIYEELGMDIYCYRVSSAETNTHTIANAPEPYKAIVAEYLGQVEDEEEEEEEESTEE